MKYGCIRKDRGGTGQDRGSSSLWGIVLNLTVNEGMENVNRMTGAERKWVLIVVGE